MENEDNKFRTADIYFAAYLKVAGVVFTGTEQEGSRIYFLFEIPETGIRDLKNQYFNRVAKVPAMTYADEIKAFKTLTHMGNER
jgi:hypothetical protein